MRAFVCVSVWADFVFVCLFSYCIPYVFVRDRVRQESAEPEASPVVLVSGMSSAVGNGPHLSGKYQSASQSR